MGRLMDAYILKKETVGGQNAKTVIHISKLLAITSVNNIMDYLG